MELNREQITKVWECCVSGDDCTPCPLIDEPHCAYVLNENTLSLIKELTAENKLLNVELGNASSEILRLIDREKELTDENERLRAGWISTAERLPEDPDKQYIVIVSGKPKSNITLVGAVFIAEFDEYDGWIIEGHEDWRGFEVLYWRELPTVPEDIKAAADIFERNI